MIFGLLITMFFCSTVAEKFLWGTATAAYQIEGGTTEDGRGPSIWDTFTKIEGEIRNGDTGVEADDSYRLMDKDILLLKEIDLNSYRFSISWSRIFPFGSGLVNERGIDHYNRLIDALVANNIEPIVTLYHWDLPQALEDRYLGWLSPAIEVDFVDFADLCFQKFGDRVKKWITLNEPWTFSYLGFVVGSFAPGRCSNRSDLNAHFRIFGNCDDLIVQANASLETRQLKDIWLRTTR